MGRSGLGATATSVSRRPARLAKRLFQAPHVHFPAKLTQPTPSASRSPTDSLHRTPSTGSSLRRRSRTQPRLTGLRSRGERPCSWSTRLQRLRSTSQLTGSVVRFCALSLSGADFQISTLGFPFTGRTRRPRVSTAMPPPGVSFRVRCTVWRWPGRSVASSYRGTQQRRPASWQRPVPGPPT